MGVLRRNRAVGPKVNLMIVAIMSHKGLNKEHPVRHREAIMQIRRSTTAIKSLVWLLLVACQLAWAAGAGQVVNLSGPLFAVDATGARRVLSMGSGFDAGETLVTEGKTYAQVRFADQSVVTLKPGTHFKVESFSFDEKAPEKDGAVFGLFKGALRTVTGLIGKRGNQDAYKMATPTATIGIRGTHYLVEYVPEPEMALSAYRVPYALPLLAALDMYWALADTMTDVPDGLFLGTDLSSFELAQAPPSGLNPGTYVYVLAGAVSMTTVMPTIPGLPTLPPLPPIVLPSGTTGFAAPPPAPGQPPPPPIIIPTPPGLAPSFNPPPSFQASQNQAQQAAPGQQPPTLSQPPQNQGGGCVVRP